MSDSEEKPSTSKSSKNQQDAEDDSAMDYLRQFFTKNLNIKVRDEAPTKVIKDLSFEGLVAQWRAHGFKNIITMVGAGISTSAGIPDFRSPGFGLYDNLHKYKLPRPSAIFEMDYFNINPQPFFALARELYPGGFKPTPSHYFVRLLHEKGLLVRHYTQNIDTLDRVAGIPDEKLVEAHGTFHTSHCLGCRKLFSMDWMKEQIFNHNVPTCDRCNSTVKPDIVFFGENLPQRFYALPDEDFKTCDLLIIMGTSLEVHPFAKLPQYAMPTCVRLLINRTKVSAEAGLFGRKNTRDVAYYGDCDDGVLALATALGWEKELKELIAKEHERLDLESKAEKEEPKVQHTAKGQEKGGTSKIRVSKIDSEAKVGGSDNQPQQNPSVKIKPSPDKASGSSKTVLKIKASQDKASGSSKTVLKKTPFPGKEAENSTPLTQNKAAETTESTKPVSKDTN